MGIVASSKKVLERDLPPVVRAMRR